MKAVIREMMGVSWFGGMTTESIDAHGLTNRCLTPAAFMLMFALLAAARWDRRGSRGGQS